MFKMLRKQNIRINETSHQTKIKIVFLFKSIFNDISFVNMGKIFHYCDPENASNETPVPSIDTSSRSLLIHLCIQKIQSSISVLSEKKKNSSRKST